MILNDVTKILSVGRAPARIWIKHYITFCRHPLKLVLENVAVSRMRSAMDVQNERVFFCRIKGRWFLHPSLNPFAVETLVGNLLRFSEIKFREKRSEEQTSELQSLTKLVCRH